MPCADEETNLTLKHVLYLHEMNPSEVHPNAKLLICPGANSMTERCTNLVNPLVGFCPRHSGNTVIAIGDGKQTAFRLSDKVGVENYKVALAEALSNMDDFDLFTKAMELGDDIHATCLECQCTGYAEAAKASNSLHEHHMRVQRYRHKVTQDAEQAYHAAVKRRNEVLALPPLKPVMRFDMERPALKWDASAPDLPPAIFDQPRLSDHEDEPEGWTIEEIPEPKPKPLGAPEHTHLLMSAPSEVQSVHTQPAIPAESDPQPAESAPESDPQPVPTPKKKGKKRARPAESQPVDVVKKTRSGKQFS